MKEYYAGYISRELAWWRLAARTVLLNRDGSSPHGLMR